MLGFLADAHGNREAFDQGVSILEREGAEAVYFLGDAVGYLPGTDVVSAIRETSVVPLRGNHEEMLLAGPADDERDAIFRHRQTAQAMSASDRNFIESWPSRLDLQSACGPLVLVHGSPADPLNGYVYPDTDLQPFVGGGHSAVFMGQTHRPFIRLLGNTLFVNVGSCGLPRDCGNLGAVCLFDDLTATARILRFDIAEATASALRRCGPVAPQVRAVFGRRSPTDCFGEAYA